MLSKHKFPLVTAWKTTVKEEHVPTNDQMQRVLSALDRIETRVKRMESRLCQLMLDQGSDIHLPEETYGGR